MEEKPRYIKCPRCELNYMLSTQDYCDVCKLEMKAGYQDEADLDDVLLEEEGAICPICKVNYISDDSKGMCDTCYEENSSMSESNDDNVDWRSFVDKDDSEEDLDLLPVEEDDEIDEELEGAFAKDLDDADFDDEDLDEDDMNDDFDDDDDFEDVDDDFDDDDLDDEEVDEDDEEDDDY